MKKSKKQTIKKIEKRLNKQKLIDAIKNNCGVKTAICEELNICYRTLENYCERWNLKEYLEEQKHRIHDKVRNNIIEMINERNEKVTLWYAERQMFDEFGNKVQNLNVNKNLDNTSEMTDEEIKAEIERKEKALKT